MEKKYRRNPNCSCHNCGKKIYRRPSQLLAGNVFCSRKCTGKAQRTNEKKCPECGKIFYAQSGGRQKNCSVRCANKSRRGLKYDGKRRKSNAVRGNKLKERLAKKRGGECEECGHQNYNILQVHHVIPKSEGGSSKNENLMLLCPNCHITIHLGESKYNG